MRELRGRSGDSSAPVSAYEPSFALRPLLIGSALLLLSAFWHDARRAVVTNLPAAVRSKLPVLDRKAQPNPA